jgi:KUP system potassium uptake protein
MVIPLVILATGASVIASQALISGAFSLTMQASQLGYTPRMRIRHTSAHEIGQIYVPAINWTLMVACVGLVVGFRSSGSLAAAYGVAVTMTMVITTLLFYFVAKERFGWRPWTAAAVSGAFLGVDLAFFGANIPKIPHGGWFPLVVGGAVFLLLTTWHTGRRIIGERLEREDIPLERFIASVMRKPPVRVPGTGVYMFSLPGLTPPALRANVRFQHALHEEVLVVSVATDDVPHVHPVKRVARTELGHGVEQIELHFGFLDVPDVPAALMALEGVEPRDTTYFVGSENIQVTKRPGMAMWRERVFAFMHRNATPAGNYFNLPAERTYGVGVQVEL